MIFTFLVSFGIILCVCPVPRAMAMENSLPGQKVAVTVGMKDNGREVGMKAGEVMQIELQTLGSAGYSWEFEDFDTDHFEIVSKEARVISDRIGAPVMRLWQLRAKKSGNARIVMYNYRLWEGREKSVNRFFLDVTIE